VGATQQSLRPCTLLPWWSVAQLLLASTPVLSTSLQTSQVLANGSVPDAFVARLKRNIKSAIPSTRLAKTDFLLHLKPGFYPETFWEYLFLARTDLIKVGVAQSL
jgi:hypothetical protein